MEDLDLAADLVRRAKARGADQAEVYLTRGAEFTVEIARGKIQELKQAASKGLGIRLFRGSHMGFVSSTDFSTSSLETILDHGFAGLELSTPEKANRLPELSRESPPDDLELYDPSIAEVPTEKKIALAREMEELAFQYDQRITNSHQSGYSDVVVRSSIVNSEGLSVSWEESSVGMNIYPMAEANGEKQMGGAWAAARFFDDLPPTSELAEQAAERALKLLGGRKVKSGSVPVIFDWQVGAIILGGLLAGINGERVYRNQSFLSDKLGQRIGSETFTVIDDGRRKRGPGSAPVDGEGVPTNRKAVVDQGVLTSFLYNSYTAHKAGTDSTGNAARTGYSSLPGISGLTFYLEPGTESVESLLADVDRGLWVWDVVGGGPDPVSGDFSAGVAGIWIEKGVPTHPVSQVTIAGRLTDIFQGIDGAASDLKLYSSVACPSFRVNRMTLSGT
ncbi:TldD/PmbA family protein [candidate division KSB1 bacterium]